MSASVQQFQAQIDRVGLWAAMRWLNQQVPYRFTAIFRFDGDILRNVCLVDKENAEVTRCADQPVMDSYCIYIHRSSEQFRLEDSLSDKRVVDHPKRASYRCYYGIPLFDRDNRMVGTVCHFNADPIVLTDSIVSTLDDLGPVIADAAFTIP